MDAFPFAAEEGRFEALFGVEEAILDYHEGWPRLEEGVAEVRFSNERLDILLQEGKLLESRAEAVRLELADLAHASRLMLSGRVRGPTADGLRVLRETPLAERQGLYVRGMSARGEAALELRMAIPVRTGARLEVEGRLRWDGAELRLRDWDLALRDLTGTLTFSEDGVVAEGLGARLWGDPLRVALKTVPGGRGARSHTRVAVDLTLDPQRLRERFPHPLWDYLAGRAPARLALDIGQPEARAARLGLDYRLESDLRGMRVDLPDPLRKAADAATPFYASGTLPAVAARPSRVGYGDIAGAFRASVRRDGALELEAGAVRCGSREAPAVGASGFSVEGRLARLDLTGWRDWLRRHRPQFSTAEPGPRSPSQRVDLTVDDLRIFGAALADARLGMVRTPNAWEAELTSERVAGSLRIPDDPRAVPISAQLGRLRLALPEAGAAPPAAGGASGPGPRDAPGLYLSVERLYLEERELGKLTLKATPVAAGLRLDEARLDGGALSLSGSGDWTEGAAGQTTRLQLQGHSPDLGVALRELAFSTAVGDADIRFRADLHWQAAPWAVSLESLAGTLDFEIGAGRLLDVDPGVGRLFGLLNLGALQRRLTLDFSDLFGAGYAFDRIVGAFVLGGGDAATDGVEITGPSADLQIEGRTGLVARDYDQVVTVTPEISVALPVAGAIAGGPVVGAALLLAGQVMGKEVNKLTRFQYQVSGPWNEPVIRRVQTQDGWSLSNLLRSRGGSEPDAAGPEPAEPEEGQGLFVH
jgi:uncharacterized protein (TIGR02099 family)